MARMLANRTFVTIFLAGLGVAHGLSLHVGGMSRLSSLPAELAPSPSSPSHGPPAAKHVMDALASINTSLGTVEDVIAMANSTAYSMADGVVQSIVGLHNVIGSVASSDSALVNRTKLLIDTARRSVEEAEANVSTTMNNLSSNLSATALRLDALAKQVASRYLEALTMVEDIYNVSRSDESLYARQAAKRAARTAVRELGEFDDDEDASTHEGALKRLVETFGMGHVEKMLRRAITKLRGSKALTSSAGLHKELQKIIDRGDFEDLVKSNRLLARRTVAGKGLINQKNTESESASSNAPVGELIAQKVNPLAPIKAAIARAMAHKSNRPADTDIYAIKHDAETSPQEFVSGEELNKKFTPEEIKAMEDRGLIEKWTKSDSDSVQGLIGLDDTEKNSATMSDEHFDKHSLQPEEVETAQYIIVGTQQASQGEVVSAAVLRQTFTADEIMEMIDTGALEQLKKADQTNRAENIQMDAGSSDRLLERRAAAGKRKIQPDDNQELRYLISPSGQPAEGEWVSMSDLRKRFSDEAIQEMLNMHIIEESSQVVWQHHKDGEPHGEDVSTRSPVGELISEKGNPLAPIKAAIDRALTHDSKKPEKTDMYAVKLYAEAPPQEFMSVEELSEKFSPKEIKIMEDHGLIEKWTKSDRDAIRGLVKLDTVNNKPALMGSEPTTKHVILPEQFEAAQYLISGHQQAAQGRMVSAAALRKTFTPDQIMEMLDTGVLEQWSKADQMAHNEDIQTDADSPSHKKKEAQRDNVSTSPAIDELMSFKGSPLASIKAEMDRAMSRQSSQVEDSIKYTIKQDAAASPPQFLPVEKINQNFSPEEINTLVEHGVIEKWTKSDDDSAHGLMKSNDGESKSTLMSDDHLSEHVVQAGESETVQYRITGTDQASEGNIVSAATLREAFSADEIMEMLDAGALEQWNKAVETDIKQQIQMDAEREPKKATAENDEAHSLLEGHVLGDLDLDSTDDLEAALLRKGLWNRGRHDACAQAADKIYHANKTLGKLSRNALRVKTTLHELAQVSDRAGMEAIEAISTTVSPALAELPDILGQPLSKGLKTLTTVKIQHGQQTRYGQLIVDAVSTIAKTASLADKLQSAVDEACLSGACGEKAKRACERAGLRP